ncbi:MAG TPA: IclR family transcriptional regulator [Roseomonas sp.]|jgi:DNA-binding IclR family transcriptional regulator
MGKHDPDPAPEGPTDDRYIVPGLSRGLEVLLAFTPERRRMTLTEMGQAVGVTRSAVFRIAYTLDQLGFLTYDPGTRTYALGPQVLRLGYGYLASRDLVEVAQPQLEALRDRTGWSAHLGVLDGREVVYLARLPTRRSLSSVVQVGTRLPAHATTMGRILLASLPPGQLKELYAGAILEPHGARTPTTLPALLAQAETDRAAGFVAHVAGYEAGVASVAAPVRDVTGATVAAINLSTVALLTSEEELRGPLAREVMAAAGRISVALGSSGEPKARRA